MTNAMAEFYKKMKSGELISLVGTDPRPDDKYNAEELALGLKEEMEHTKDKELANVIAKDHLDERPDYYSKLKEAMG